MTIADSMDPRAEIHWRLRENQWRQRQQLNAQDGQAVERAFANSQQTVQNPAHLQPPLVAPPLYDSRRPPANSAAFGHQNNFLPNYQSWLQHDARRPPVPSYNSRPAYFTPYRHPQASSHRQTVPAPGYQHRPSELNSRQPPQPGINVSSYAHANQSKTYTNSAAVPPLTYASSRSQVFPTPQTTQCPNVVAPMNDRNTFTMSGSTSTTNTRESQAPYYRPVNVPSGSDQRRTDSGGPSPAHQSQRGMGGEAQLGNPHQPVQNQEVTHNAALRTLSTSVPVTYAVSSSASSLLPVKSEAEPVSHSNQSCRYADSNNRQGHMVEQAPNFSSGVTRNQNQVGTVGQQNENEAVHFTTFATSAAAPPPTYTSSTSSQGLFTRIPHRYNVATSDQNDRNTASQGQQYGAVRIPPGAVQNQTGIGGEAQLGNPQQPPVQNQEVGHNAALHGPHSSVPVTYASSSHASFHLPIKSEVEPGSHSNSSCGYSDGPNHQGQVVEKAHDFIQHQVGTVAQQPVNQAAHLPNTSVQNQELGNNTALQGPQTSVPVTCVVSSSVSCSLPVKSEAEAVSQSNSSCRYSDGNYIQGQVVEQAPNFSSSDTRSQHQVGIGTVTQQPVNQAAHLPNTTYPATSPSVKNASVKNASYPILSSALSSASQYLDTSTQNASSSAKTETNAASHNIPSCVYTTAGVSGQAHAVQELPRSSSGATVENRTVSVIQRTESQALQSIHSEKPCVNIDRSSGQGHSTQQAPNYNRSMPASQRQNEIVLHPFKSQAVQPFSKEQSLNTDGSSGQGHSTQQAPDYNRSMPASQRQNANVRPPSKSQAVQPFNKDLDSLVDFFVARFPHHFVDPNFIRKFTAYADKFKPKGS